MIKKYSVFEILRKDENKVKAQKIVLKKIWDNLKSKYSNNYKYYDYYFNLVAIELFDIISFESLLITSDYESIWNYFYIQDNLNDKFLAALEFFYNIFYTSILFASKDFDKNYYYNNDERKKDFSEKFQFFTIFISELTKFFDWVGYSLIKYDNQVNKDSEYKEYHLVKKDIVKIIETIKVSDDLKTLLLELSQERLEIKDLENYLSIIYNNYLDVEQGQIKKYLGNKLHSDIFNLFNNGLIKHKDSENLNKLSQFNEQERINALKWLKDMVFVYFAVSRNGNDYPERIINFKHKNNAN